MTKSRNSSGSPTRHGLTIPWKRLRLLQSDSERGENHRISGLEAFYHESLYMGGYLVVIWRNSNPPSHSIIVIEREGGLYWLGAYPNNSFTLAEMARPSAKPASFLVAVPITLPMSLGPVAPTSAMISFRAASSSSALICLGK